MTMSDADILFIPVFRGSEWDIERLGEQLAAEGIAWIDRPGYELHLPNGKVMGYVEMWPDMYTGAKCYWKDIDRPIATRDP